MKTCNSCQEKIAQDLPFCPKCGSILELYNIHHTPVDHKVHFFTRRYLYFLFFTKRGRLNRERYITAHFFVLSLFLVYLIIAAVAATFIGHFVQSAVSGFEALWVILGIGMVSGFVLTIPLKIKRAHDLDYNPHWCWLWAIPGVSLIAELWFWIKGGTAGPNKHGLCPRGKNPYSQGKAK